jgi:hypothetical protein
MRSDRGITGVTFFMSDEHLAGDDAGDQEVAMFLCAPEKIEVADMKQIKGPWRLMTPLINTLRHYTRPRVRENNGCWSSSWVNASISGRNQRSGIVGIRS